MTSRFRVTLEAEDAERLELLACALFTSPSRQAAYLLRWGISHALRRWADLNSESVEEWLAETKRLRDLGRTRGDALVKLGVLAPPPDALELD